MRLFVALKPPQGALAELEASVAPLRGDWPRLRWSSQDRWHVTLAFLGEVAEPKLDELATRLARAASRHAGQELKVGRGSAFPSPARARVLIAHLEGGQAALSGLSALAGSVAASARRAGAPPPDEGRRYRPHLTLARCKEPTDLSELVRSLPGQAAELWSPTEIHLIRSQNGPQPRYDVLGSWRLKGS